MHSIAVTTYTAEYDLLDEKLPAEILQTYFGKPLAIWEPSMLELGEAEAVRKAFVRSAETRTIEIDREEHVVWVTYAVTIEFDYNPDALSYFGANLEQIVRHGCHVSFPLDERKVEFVDEELAIRLS